MRLTPHGLVVIALVAAACAGESDRMPSPSPMVTGLTIAGVTMPVRVGQSVQLTATATLAGGTTRPVTDVATWQSSDPRVVTVARGLVTAVAVGTTTIAATYQGATGSTTVFVFAQPPPP
ncbi:MAG: Ig-like domain-containing protein [Vicinamibacterales bacterium]